VVSFDNSRSLKAKRDYKRIGKRNMPLCMGNGDVKHILLSCPETKNVENAISQ
jgi:hypothetical protein